MKTIILIFVIFLTSCGLQVEKGPKIIDNLEVYNFKCSEFLEDPLNSIKKYNYKDDSILKIMNNYISIKGIITNDIILKEYENEYKINKAFFNKACNIITEKYAKDLCDIYVSQNLELLNTFPFEDGETKDETIMLFNSLYEGKLLSGVNEYSFLFIKNFDKYKNNINFNFIDISIDKNRIDYYTYYVENGKKSFLEELDNQFLIKCKDLNNEK